MRSRGHDRLLRRLKKIEERRLPGSARSDASAVWARLLPVMGRGDPEAVRRALQDLPTWDLLIPTMLPEHPAIVLDTFANDDWVSAQTGRSSLALAVYHALGGVWSGPVAIPEVVGEVYLNDAETLPIHSCEACGLPNPDIHRFGGGEARRLLHSVSAVRRSDPLGVDAAERQSGRAGWVSHTRLKCG